jgi:hypothetical protein
MPKGPLGRLNEAATAAVIHDETFAISNRYMSYASLATYSTESVDFRASGRSGLGGLSLAAAVLLLVPDV